MIGRYCIVCNRCGHNLDPRGHDTEDLPEADARAAAEGWDITYEYDYALSDEPVSIRHICPECQQKGTKTNAPPSRPRHH